MLRSLQSRVTVSFVGVIAAAVLALSIGISVLYGQALRTQYLATYRNNGAIVADIIDESLQGTLLSNFVDAGQLRDVVGRLSNQFHLRIQISLSAYNQVVADSGPAHPAQAMPSHHLVVDDFPAVQEPLSADGLPIGTITLSTPLTDRAYQQQQFERNVLLVDVAACLLAFLIGGILAERLTAPFSVLTRATTRMGEGHLNERVREGRRDEAGELAHQFNRMAERLEQSFATISAERDRLRQFVADVSHELRTPLTALRTFNDLLQDGAGADAHTRRDFLAESARQIDRLDWLTHNLLDLSRLDSGLTRVAPRPADLADTVRRAVEANRPAAAAREVTLLVDAAPLAVAHDPPRLEQAINNVVGNAVKFSPRGGTVRVRLYRGDGEAVVEVSDEGPGIPPEEVPHIFERFYRGRDANRAGEGSGLGLAIARAIQDAHGGSIAVDSRPGHGTTMRLTLPLAAAPEPAEAAAAP